MNPAEVAVWWVLTGVGVGRGVLETPDVCFPGASMVLERLEMEGLVVSCCRDCGFVGEVPEVGPTFLLGVLLVRSVVLELAVLENAA